LYTGKISSWNNCWRLVVDTALESSWAPVNELNSTLGLDGSNGSVDILWNNISTEHHTASHELSVTGIALGHHVRRLENGVTDLLNGKLLVVGLLGRDDRSVRGKHKVNTRVRYQVGLELGKINVQSTIETKGGCERGNNLGDKSVQVGVCWALNVKRTSAYIV
jgi:hypothetical protein